MDFETFYAAYPRRVGKRDAQKAWKALKPDTDMTAHIMGLLEFRKADEWRGRKKEHIPYPATFLRGEDFMDDVEDKADDKEPLLKLTAAIEHWCRWCEIPHHWRCDDDTCSDPAPMACPAFQATLKGSVRR